MKNYNAPEIEIVRFSGEDIITTSSFTLALIELDDDDTPKLG